MDAPICPECRDGKHRNCDGTAWDDLRDQAASCTCAHHEPLEDPAQSEGLHQILPTQPHSFTLTVRSELTPDAWARLFPNAPQPVTRHRLAFVPGPGADPVAYDGLIVPVEGGIEFREDPAPTDREPLVLFIAYPPTKEES